MRRSVALLPLVFVVAMGCDGGSKGVNVQTGDMGPACAAYSACFGRVGMSHCVAGLDLLRHYDIENSTLELAQLYLFVNWLDMLALAQNIRCVVSAGGDCNKVLACMNQGVMNTGCTPSEDHARGYYCVDDKKLARCMQVTDGYFNTTVEISVLCSALGLKCAEMPMEFGDPWIACVNERVDVTDGIEVTCDGTVASVTFGGGVMREDCKNRGGTCAPGSYVDIDQIEEHAFCDAPACDSGTFVDHCEGNDRLYCSYDKQVSVPCDEFGLVCREETIDSTVHVTCSYPGCEVLLPDETCEVDKATYCGPEGYRSVSCSDLGFITCRVGTGGTLVGCFSDALFP